jgi:hypothetical protein
LEAILTSAFGISYGSTRHHTPIAEEHISISAGHTFYGNFGHNLAWAKHLGRR